MQKRKCIAVCMFTVCQIMILTAQSSLNYSKAREYLKQKGEVYFKYYVLNQSQIEDLVNSLSIDKVDHSEVYAYANSEEFNHFLSTNTEYTVLLHPEDMKEPPVMSDYQDYDPRGATTFDKYPTFEG